MAGETLIRVDGVSKKFARSLKRSLWYAMKDIAGELNPLSRGSSDRSSASGLRPDEFWAVDDVSFELARGECLGLIGKNGAGKTTLLKMVNGLIKPDRGRIETRGRVGGLIALGAGFNPILTGRENVYVNASVVGLTRRETDAKLDEIIDFAEIGDFIDSPVQNYSSGMQVRLGFAVATAFDPDILILDEVLAVGDAAFRAKCYNRIGAMQKKAAVIIVSHNSDQIARISDRVLLMSKGKPAFLGPASEGIPLYESESSEHAEGEEGFIALSDPVTKGAVRLEKDVIDWNDSMVVEVELEAAQAVEDLVFHGIFFDASGQIVASFGASGDQGAIQRGTNRLRVVVDRIPLASGSYPFALSIQPRSSVQNLIWSYKQVTLKVRGSASGAAACRLAAAVTRSQAPMAQKVAS